MAYAGTLKPTFSKAVKTLLKTNHSCSHEVKRYITQFMFAINHLERQNGLRGYQWRLVPRTKKRLLTNPRRDFPNKGCSDSLRRCLWVCSNSNRVAHSRFLIKVSPLLMQTSRTASVFLGFRGNYLPVSQSWPNWKQMSALTSTVFFLNKLQTWTRSEASFPQQRPF